MWSLFEIFITLLGGFVAWTLYINVNRQPKGPFRLPILGNLHLVAMYMKNDSLHELFVEYGEIYGKMFSFQLGSFSAVVLNDHKLIKEAFNHPQITGRPHLPPASERCGDGVNRGLILQDGDEWTEQRRFSIRHLRDFGFGKKSMDSLVMDEVVELIDNIKKVKGKPISTQNRFNLAVLNALWSITAGERFKHDDPELEAVVQAITRNVGTSGFLQLLFFVPWALKALPNLPAWKQFKADQSYPFNLLKKFTDKTLKEFDGSELNTFTDVYIDEIRKTKDPHSSFYGTRGEKTMTATLMDLFVAGAETTSTTLTFACLYLALNPEKQKKLQKEIDAILGTKLPTQDNRPSMPYTEAVIFETMRLSSMVPLGLFHRTLDNVTLGGYAIPKDTMIMGNLHAVHHDPEIWGDPKAFRPERFLSPDESSVIKHEALIPFSVGKRVCLGETLAKNELFLFVTSLLQQFDITWDPERPKPNYEKNHGVVASPKPHYLIFKERQV